MLRLVFPAYLALSGLFGAAAAQTPPAASKAAAPPAKAAASASDAAATRAVAALVDRVQRRYDKTSDLRASFTQTYTQPAFNNKAKTSSGALALKKPGKIRFDYETPEKEMYLANGPTIFHYQPDEKLVLQMKTERSYLPAAVAFLMGKGKLKDDFEVSRAPVGAVPSAGSKEVTLSLRPKQGGGYKTIYFVVDPSSGLVTQSVLVDAQGNTNAFTFSNIETNSKLGDDHFEWAAPKGVRVEEI